jgi:hypothetical protein
MSCDDSGDPVLTLAAAASALVDHRPDEAVALSGPIFHAENEVMREMAYWISGHAKGWRAQVDWVREALFVLPTRRPPPGAAFDEAEADFRSALAIADRPSLWNDLGVLSFSFARLARAKTLFERCLSREPAHRHATINYAVTLLAEGRTEAVAAYLGRTVFSADLPPSLKLRQAIGQIAVGRETVLPRRDSREWMRWGAYSYDWRRRLPLLFDQTVRTAASG